MPRKKKTLTDIQEQLEKGELTPQEAYHSYIRTEEWKKVHDSVLLRDNYTCCCCNRTKEEIDLYNNKKGKNALTLVVHHKTYKELFKEELNNYKDLITLCSPCHKAIHSCPNNRQRFKFNI